MDGSQWSSTPYDRPIAPPAPGSALPPPPTWESVAPAPEVRGWKKFFAIAGVVFAFPFLLTLPGWWTLSIYRQWKAGTRSQPNGLIAWGVIACVLLSLVLVGVAASDGSLGSRPPTDTYGYTQGMRQGFVAGCTKGGGSEGDCTCYFEALERHYTPEEFQTEAKKYQTTGAFSDETIQALQTCL